MSFKTICVPLTAFEKPGPAFTSAMALARTHDAHLEVICLGLNPSQTSYFEMGSSAMLVQAALEGAIEHANAIEASVSDYLESSMLRWESVTEVATTSGAGRAVAMHARFSDLAIVDQPCADRQTGDLSLVLEGLLFHSACPTLVVPELATFQMPQSIIIAWDQSDQALLAAQRALPFLHAAKAVHIAIVDPPQHGEERSDPGGALALYLARHGITVDIQVLSRAGHRVSDRLCQHATEMGSDMLVMGGYGHSPMREAILGGVTREMLEKTKIPLFLAH